jgi:choice-of-anchor A domain-containing protein
MAILFLSRWMDRFLTVTPTAVRSKSRRTHLNVESLEDRSVPSATDLGIANDFNAFVFDDFNAQYSDSEGRLAVGGNASLTGYGVGTLLPNSNGTRDDLIVGGDLNFRHGQVFFGNAVFGGTGTLEGVGLPNGTARQESGVVDFAAAEMDLQMKSIIWSNFIPNGTVTKEWGSLRFDGVDADINVFALEASDLNPCYGMTFNVPSSSTVVINVSGTVNQLQYFWMNLNGLDKTHVLFNFFETEQLTIQGIGVFGSVLAPFADVSFSNGNVDGTLVAESVTGGGQLNLFRNQLNVTPPPVVNSSLGGSVFEFQERFQIPLAEIRVILSGLDDRGDGVSKESVTDEFGAYFFEGLRSGIYSLEVLPPDGLVPGQEFIGSLGGDRSPGMIFDIIVNINDNGSGYNFGLRRV